MNFKFSITDSPAASIGLGLRTVYMVQADHSYDVRKKENENNDIVVIRTINGVGKILIEGFNEIDNESNEIQECKTCMELLLKDTMYSNALAAVTYI